MTRNLLRAGALSCALLTSTAMCTQPALAQAKPQPEFVLDDGEVDLWRGDFLHSSNDIAIGPDPAEGGLALERYHGMTVPHNLHATVDREPYYIEGHGPGMVSWRYTVTIGRIAETFEWFYGFNAIWDVPTRYGKLTAPAREGPFTYTLRDGTIFQFSSADCQQYGCVATSRTQPNGVRTDFSYDILSNGSRRLRRAVTNRGYGVGFEYPTLISNIASKVCAFNLTEAATITSAACPTGARATTYGFNGPGGALSNVTLPNGEVTTYNYDANGFLSGIRRHGSSADNLTLTYHPQSGKVASLTSAGRTRSYNYQIIDTPWAFAPTNAWTEVTDGAGQVTRTEFSNGTSFPTSVRDPLLRTTTMQYTGNYGHLLQRRTAPEGNAVQHGYDARDNMTETRRIAKPGSGLADLVATSSFPASCANQVTCNLPSSATDANGHTTDYTYDASHGGVLTETGPAVGGIRPQTRHEYAQRYAWLSNGSGGYVQAANPVWVRTATSTCRTSAATGNPASPCATSGDEVRTSYDYGPNSGPNNLLLRGQAVTADGTTLRTCFTYDASGNRISETSPGAQLAQCQ